MSLILMSLPVLVVALQYLMPANRQEPCPVVANLRRKRLLRRKF